MHIIAHSTRRGRSCCCRVGQSQGLVRAGLCACGRGGSWCCFLVGLAFDQSAAGFVFGQLVVGRTALKLRNPLNAPPTWAVGALDGLDSARVFDLGEGRAGYLEPIRLEVLCTTCHGAAVEPALRQRITTLYPAGQATGFSTGDLRGAFWAELPPDR